MMRPQPLRFMCGTALRMVWKELERLIAMIWSHFSTGKSSIFSTCWMPALLTRMSTPSKVSTAVSMRSEISCGFVMSAGW